MLLILNSIIFHRQVNQRYKRTFFFSYWDGVIVTLNENTGSRPPYTIHTPTPWHTLKMYDE